MSKIKAPNIIVPKSVRMQWGIDGDRMVLVIQDGARELVFPMTWQQVQQHCSEGMIFASRAQRATGEGAGGRLRP